jgi:cytochrome c556
MKRAALLLLLASCQSESAPADGSAAPAGSGQPAKPPSGPTAADLKAKAKQFVTCMELNDKLIGGIEQDIKESRGDAAIKERLKKLRQNCEAAKKLRYRKESKENDELDEFFDLFFTFLAEFEEASWTLEASGKLWKSLQNRCSTCHARFREQ